MFNHETVHAPLAWTSFMHHAQIQAQFINIPKQCIIAFYASDWDPEEIVSNPQEFIQFYVEGTTGNAFSQKDLDQYMISQIILLHIHQRRQQI